MPKSLKGTGTSTFYSPVKDGKEIRAGYLYKSPPSHRLKTEKSWKKRYFVLLKVNEKDYLFKYWKRHDDQDKPLGSINLDQILLLYVSPQHHQKCSWIQKIFKCSSSCVLYIKTTERDYFLIGENSMEVDGWFSDLFDALKTRPHKVHTTEEMANVPAIQVISNPIVRRRSSPAVPGLSIPKMRSMSDPSSNTLDSISDADEDFTKRRSSEPVQPVYDIPRFFMRSKDLENGVVDDNSAESLYETMMEIRLNQPQSLDVDREVEEFNTGTLLKSVNDIFDRMKTQISPLASCAEEMANEDRQEKRQSSEFSSSSSDNGAISPVEMLEGRNVPRLDKQSSTESLDHISPEERDIEVKRADMKKHLTLIEVDGKPSVSGWTGQPQTVCLFHKGDQILAVNDLHTGSIEEFNMYLSKTLKNEVKVTILRLPGCQPLHSLTCLCTDTTAN